MRHFEVEQPGKPHWLPPETPGLQHDLSSDCWCEPVEFSDYFAHRKCEEKVVATEFPLDFEKKRHSDVRSDTRSDARG